MAGNTNAILGSLLASVLGAMAIGLGAQAVFHNDYPAHPGFAPVVSAESTGGGPAQPSGPPDFGRLFADQTQLADLVSRGQRATGVCQSCHAFDEAGGNKTGPNLHDVFGRHAASHPGFDYSDAMKAHNVTWSYLTLDDFLKSPGTVVRGTRMTFAGLPRQEDRVAVIAYLRSISPHQEPLPAPLPQQTAATTTGTAATTGAASASTTPATNVQNPPTTNAPAQPARAQHRR